MFNRMTYRTMPITTRHDARHAAELAVPLAKHLRPGDALDVAFLADVARDFPCLFTDEYRRKFGPR